MKLIISGGRKYRLTGLDRMILDMLHKEHKLEQVIVGGATGADMDGGHWAMKQGIPVEVFGADWQKHGRAAGPIRNRAMAKYGDAVILFPGGRGTASMYKEAKAYGLTIFDFRDGNYG